MSKLANRKCKRLDHASFTSRDVVRSAGKHGRGLFAAVDVKAGDAILCEKAFCVAFNSDAEAGIYMIVNLNTGHGSVGTQATLLFNLTQKLLHNSAQAARFLVLFDGGYSPRCTGQVVDGLTSLSTCSHHQ